MDSLSALDAFRSLFRGREDAWGGEINPLGEGRAVAIKHQMTALPWYGHLFREHPIGIYNAMDGDICWWSALDFDDDDYQKAVDAARAYALFDASPWVERSRRKGWHVWIFHAEPVPLAVARSAGLGVLNLLEMDLKTEVYPKQSKIQGLKYGNFLRTPYAGWYASQPALVEGERLVDGRIIRGGGLFLRALSARQATLDCHLVTDDRSGRGREVRLHLWCGDPGSGDDLHDGRWASRPPTWRSDDGQSQTDVRLALSGRCRCVRPDGGGLSLHGGATPGEDPRVHLYVDEQRWTAWSPGSLCRVILTPDGRALDLPDFLRLPYPAIDEDNGTHRKMVIEGEALTRDEFLGAVTRTSTGALERLAEFAPVVVPLTATRAGQLIEAALGGTAFATSHQAVAAVAAGSARIPEGQRDNTFYTLARFLHGVGRSREEAEMIIERVHATQTDDPGTYSLGLALAKLNRVYA